MARKSRKQNTVVSKAIPETVGALYKAALYARLSWEKEENVERGTIETQMELMKNYVADSDDIEVFDEYFDASYTGTNFDRPDFNRMMGDIRAGKVNCVIVKDLSRLGRNYVEMGNYIERVFPFLNVRFIAITDNFDSFRPGTDLMMPLKNIANEYYAKDISRKVSVSMRQMWEEGKFSGRFAPYGYKKSENDIHRLEVDEAVADTVREIYDLFVEGMGYRQIAGRLNEEQIPSPMNYWKSLGVLDSFPKAKTGVWHSSTVKGILQNRYYVGDMVHGKMSGLKCENTPRHHADKEDWVISENTHEAIISRELFSQVQDRIEEIADKAAERKEAKNTRKAENLLKGKIVCGKCGMAMRLETLKRKPDHYRCGNFVIEKQCYCAACKVDREDAEQAVFSVIRSHIKCCMDSLRVIRDLNARTNGVQKYNCFSDAVRKHRKDIGKTGNKRADLYADYSDGLINEEEYLLLMDKYNERIEQLESEINMLLEQQKLYEKEYHINEDWEKLVETYSEKRKLTRTMVETFVEKVVCKSDGNIEVRLLYDDLLYGLVRIRDKRRSE